MIPDPKVDKIIQTNYTASFMNNSKWLKLIRLLVDNAQCIARCDVKLIYDDKIRQLMINGEEQFNFDFYENAMEAMITNPIAPGWTLYKEIEWICFPISSENSENILKLTQLVQKSGEFHTHRTDEYYRIIAYI
ncbi:MULTISPECIES: hypothetical protein [unclassified Flavobacterium]|uniref:hypothetical protein n=1 Tax=unclassified Flavobacterium TaxID=196869 RepID=UPI0036196DC7